MVTPRSPLLQGGVERHVLEVSRHLQAAGVAVTVLCADPGGPAVAEQQRDGVLIRSVRGWPEHRDWYLAPGMWPQIGAGGYDLVHVQSYHTLVAPLAMLRSLSQRVPYVVTFHGGGHSSPLRNRVRGLHRRALAPLLSRAARLIAVAPFEIEQYSRELRLPRERFTLVPNGTDLVAVPAGANGDGARDAAVLASIGRLERYKGHHRVIDALPHVVARRPDARLLIVGTGPYEGALRRRARIRDVADRVQFTSVPAADREGMAAVLREISLVVLMSEFETHPLVALEAAAARRRLLVADRGGLLELARDGIARAVPLAASPETLATAIVEQLATPPPTASPSLASWEQCAQGVLSVYRSVLAS
jgi:glycosyltransferase involved in cell wall biosynthesis